MIVALDLEGTLISNAQARMPRPGLFEFLEKIRVMADRVVVFTFVPEPIFREIAEGLVAQGEAPAWFAWVECVDFDRDKIFKDLNDIPGVEDITDAWLIDDCEMCVHPDQHERCILIPVFDPPKNEIQSVFSEVLCRLSSRM